MHLIYKHLNTSESIEIFRQNIYHTRRSIVIILCQNFVRSDQPFSLTIGRSTNTRVENTHKPNHKSNNRFSIKSGFLVRISGTTIYYFGKVWFALRVYIFIRNYDFYCWKMNKTWTEKIACKPGWLDMADQVK